MEQVSRFVFRVTLNANISPAPGEPIVKILLKNTYWVSANALGWI